jgi:acetylornithine deacetylase/succinyl-diaminopimelate desuccinylase-like protein
VQPGVGQPKRTVHVRTTKGNAASYGSTDDVTDRSTPLDRDGVIDLAGLASTSSVSGTEEAAIGLVRDAMVALGFDTVRVDDVGNVIGILGTGPGPRLLIDGHIDTIPLHSVDRWTKDPFGGEIVDGRLYGLGICDQKASIAAAVHGVAAEAALGELAGSVAVVASVGEEEMEGLALASALEWFGPDLVITSEPSDTRLCIGQRGAQGVRHRHRPGVPRRPRVGGAQRGRGARRTDRRGRRARAPGPRPARRP